MTVTKCITIHTFSPESKAPSLEKWVNCVNADSTTQQPLNTTSELESASPSHILHYINVPNQQPYHLPMLITPVLCVYLVTFDLRYQKESLSKIHSVLKNVYTLHFYRSKAGMKNHPPKVLLVGMHADKVTSEDKSRFTQKLDERLEKMPYHRMVEKPGGAEPFWAVEGGDLSPNGNDVLSEQVQKYGCSQQVEVHQWIVRHSKLLDQEELQRSPCKCYAYHKLKEKVDDLSSDPTGLKFDDWLQFLHNYNFIFYHSVKVEEEAEESRKDQEADKVVMLQPQHLCDQFAKVLKFCHPKEFFTIADFLSMTEACNTLGPNIEQWFQHVCIDMGQVFAVKSDYVFLMALKGGPPGCPPHEEYSIPPLLMTFRDSNHFTTNSEYLLPSNIFAAFVTMFLKFLSLPKSTDRCTVIEQHYVQVKKDTTLIHIVERDFCIEIGLQQLDVMKLTDETKVEKLYTFCRDVQRAVDMTAKSISNRLNLNMANICYGFYHLREAENGPMDSFAAYVSEGPYLECFCCDGNGGMQPTTPLQRIWFQEDFPLREVSVQISLLNDGKKVRKLKVVPQVELPSSVSETGGSGEDNTSSQTVNDTPLSVVPVLATATSPPPKPPATPDSGDILAALNHQLDHRWSEFGAFLHVDYPTREAIRARIYNEPRAYMLDLVDKWTTRQAGTGSLPRTWHTIVDAVKDTGFPDLAKTLAVTYGVTLSH